MQGDGLEGAVGMKDNFSSALRACVREKEKLQVAVFWGNLFQFRPGERASETQEEFPWQLGLGTDLHR